MKLFFKQSYIKIEKVSRIDIFLMILVSFFPLLMILSIFLADLFASLSSIIIVYISIKKKNFFKNIKYQSFFFLSFYFIILLSLIFSNSIENSFLPSFFYFRYFLFALAIYYLIEHHVYFRRIFFYSLLITLSFVIFDSLFQAYFKFNTIGLNIQDDTTKFVSSFFDDEKKLGSYIIRLLPLTLSTVYYFNLRKISIYIILFSGLVIFFSSERTAMFLFVFFLISYLFIIKNKIKFICITSLMILLIFSLNPNLKYKYFDYTLKQLGLIDTTWNQDYNNIVRYYSKEHENLSLTASFIFKKNYLNGIGIKNFYEVCNLHKANKNEEQKKYFDYFKRNNNIQCSTHPHNTYLQILSEIGIFGFLIIFYIFIFIIRKNIKIILKQDFRNIKISYYLINIGILINLFPLIPSGNFFNNWLSLILFYPLGMWFYLNKRLNIK